MEKLVELVGGGSVINGAYLVYFFFFNKGFLSINRCSKLEPPNCTKVVQLQWIWWIPGCLH